MLNFEEMKYMFLVLINQFNINEFKKFMLWLDNLLEEYKKSGYGCITKYQYELKRTCDHCKIDQSITAESSSIASKPAPKTATTAKSSIRRSTSNDLNDCLNNDQQKQQQQAQYGNNTGLKRRNTGQKSGEILKIIRVESFNGTASASLTTKNQSDSKIPIVNVETINSKAEESSLSSLLQQKNFLNKPLTKNQAHNSPISISITTLASNDEVKKAVSQLQQDDEIETISNMAMMMHASKKGEKKNENTAGLDLNLEVMSDQDHCLNHVADFQKLQPARTRMVVLKGHDEAIVTHENNDEDDEDDDEMDNDIEEEELIGRRARKVSVKNSTSDSSSSNVNEEKLGANGGNEVGTIDVNGGPRKRRGKAFTALQKYELEKLFNSKKYISSEERNSLALRLDLTQVQVKDWFKNHRKLMRRSLTQQIEKSFAVVSNSNSSGAANSGNANSINNTSASSNNNNNDSVNTIASAANDFN